MPLSLKTKQVAGVTLIVGLAVILLSGWYIASLATIWLGQAQVRAEFLVKTITDRASDAVRANADPVVGIQNDEGLRSILAAIAAYDANVQYAAIVNTRGEIIVHIDPDRIGTMANAADDLPTLLKQSPLAQLQAIFREGQAFEQRAPLLLDAGGGKESEFGSVRVAISPYLLRSQMTEEMRTPIVTAGVAILLALLVAVVLAQIALHPIHVIRSGLAKLGRGELDVSVDLEGDAELAELGDSFKAVTARLAADRTELAGQRATLESVVDSLEDAVALFDANGSLLFANPAMRPSLGAASGPIADLLPAGHPYRTSVEAALAGGKAAEAVTVEVAGIGERLLLVHAVEDTDGRRLGVMVVARNLAYLSQVESTINYSRKLAALSRLSAGIAHEVKNPLNATMIHLELLKMQLGDAPGALEHVAVITAQMRRLDEVVQGFLKFTRPEDLHLSAVTLLPLVEELMPVISAEASKSGVEVKLDFPPGLPDVNADAGMLQQAFLNLGLNACQAMPNGGRLRIAGRALAKREVEVVFEDTGVGISPENLARIFDLYFTTKEHGSGIGLSLVYRTVQLHDGQIEVQSTPGHGATFRLVLHEAEESSAAVSDEKHYLPPTGTLGLRRNESR